MTKIIFWDYDGTIVDTEIIYKNSIISFLKEQDLLLKEIDDSFFYKYINGHHPESFLSKLEESNFIKTSNIINPDIIREYYNNFFKNLKAGEIKIIKNIDKTIDKISKYEDIIMCITSSSMTEDFIIKSNNVNNEILNKHFNISNNVYLCDLSKGIRCKPYPDIFNHAFNETIKKYNLNLTKKDKLFIIDDSEAGCKGGKAFKDENYEKIDINIVGYTTGMDIKEYKQEYIKKLINTGIDHIIDTTEDLFNLITYY